MFQTFKTEFAQLLSKIFNIPAQELENEIALAPENVEGDFAFPCFKLSKTLQKTPIEIAKQGIEELSKMESQLFSSFVMVGPYLNAKINVGSLAKEILEKIEKEKSDFGKGESTGKKILIEGRQPNTHKTVHIGHVRNILLSESISRIMEFAGNEVIKCSYPGDIGAHVAKWMWYFINFCEEKTFPTVNFSKRVGELYTKATLKVDENPDQYKKEIEELQKRLEDGDEELVKIWKETRKLCLDDLVHICTELGTTRIDRRYYESEVEQEGIKIVKEMEQKGIAQYSQGAIAMDLTAYKLDWFLLLKSNGASLYSAKDIALAYKKWEEYHYDESLYIVGSEQIHHFEQLFKTLELCGFDAKKLHHIAYGLISLKSGKMSSRAGNVVLYEDFRDQVLTQAQEMLKEREIPDSEKEEIARKVAFSAIKFVILLQDSEKGIIFDDSQALSFEGETGPYLEYTYARLCSVLKKGEEENSDFQKADGTLLQEDLEKKILLQMAQFSDLVQKASATYKPNYIARFILDLAQTFNTYYHSCKIHSDDHELTKARLRLCAIVAQVFNNAFYLLGIEEVEVM